MSYQRQLTFQTPAELPSPDELLRHLDRQHYLLLQFPSSAVEGRKEDLIRRLKQQLPEYCAVFDASSLEGQSRITIIQVISRPELLAVEDELLQGARHFRKSASALALRLAEHNRIPVEDLGEYSPDLEPFPGDWTIDSHGLHLCFANQKTGQVVEVALGFGREFGILEPWFFHTYLRTTPGLCCPPELSNHHHDTGRALDHLEERGWLNRIGGINGLSVVFAPDT